MLLCIHNILRSVIIIPLREGPLKFVVVYVMLLYLGYDGKVHYIRTDGLTTRTASMWERYYIHRRCGVSLGMTMYVSVKRICTLTIYMYNCHTFPDVDCT